jgi:hypothetical protein
MSTAAPPATAAAGHQRLLAAVEAQPMVPALVILVLITAGRVSGTVDSDVAWQLWIAGRIHAGANLYRDIVETNPPLWFWMALPIDRLAALLQLRVEAVLAIVIGLISAGALAATDQLIRHVPVMRRAALLAAGALALTFLPWVHLGQREQLVLIGTVPYCALIASRRRERRPVPALLAALIGTGAALGFALKHYFAIVPLLLELWLFVGLKRGWRPIRPETVALAIGAIIYVTAIVALEGDYLTEIVPLLDLAYGSFGASSFGDLFGPLAIAGLATGLLLAVHVRLLSGRDATFAAALSVAAVGFGAVYFFQFKGWHYHAIPLAGCGSLALAALLVEGNRLPSSLRILSPALLVLPLAISSGEIRGGKVLDPDLAAAIAGLPPGTPIGFITENSAVAWSVTLQRQFRYPSRYNGFWMLGAVKRNELRTRPDPRVIELGRRVVRQTVADFRCLPPRRIIIQRPLKGAWNEHGLDPLPYFMRNADFAELLSHYRAVSRTTFDVYEQVSPLSAPTGACRHRV